MKKITLTFLTLFFLSGCAVQKEWGTSGGSKSDGTVELSFTYGLFEKPQIDNKKGLEKAKKSCMTWGYSSAEEFEFLEERCLSRNAYGDCLRAIVTKKYQCID